MIRAAAHLHSTFSYDGKLTLLELRELLEQHGVSCAFMTEHADDFTAQKFADFARGCAEASTPEFLFIPGLEVAHKDAHILMLGLRGFPQGGSLRDFKALSGFAVLAHPHRNHYLLEPQMREVTDAVEVWNSQYDGKHALRPRAEWLRRGDDKKIFVGWDLHRRSHAGGPVLEIDAPLEAGAVLEALRAEKYRVLPESGSPVRGAFDRAVIALGRMVNAFLKDFGVKLPRSLTERMRKNI